MKKFEKQSFIVGDDEDRAEREQLARDVAKLVTDSYVSAMNYAVHSIAGCRPSELGAIRRFLKEAGTFGASALVGDVLTELVQVIAGCQEKTKHAAPVRTHWLFDEDVNDRHKKELTPPNMSLHIGGGVTSIEHFEVSEKKPALTMREILEREILEDPDRFIRRGEEAKARQTRKNRVLSRLRDRVVPGREC